MLTCQSFLQVVVYSDRIKSGVIMKLCAIFTSHPAFPTAVGTSEEEDTGVWWGTCLPCGRAHLLCYPSERARSGPDPRIHSPAQSWQPRVKPDNKHPHSTGTGSPLPAPNSAVARGTCCWEEVPTCTKHISVCLLEIHIFPPILLDIPLGFM